MNESETGAEVAQALATKLQAIYGRLFPPGTARHRVYQAVLRPALLGVARHLGPPPPPPPVEEPKDLPPPPCDGAIRCDPMDLAEVRRILLVKLDHIGDFIVTSPAFALVRETFPAAEITLLCCPWNRAIALRSGFFDRVECIDVFAERAENESPVPDFSPAHDALAALPEFDLAIDLKVEGHSREVLGHVRARLKAGYAAETAPADMAIALPRPPIERWDRHASEQHVGRLIYMLVSAVINEVRSVREQRRAVTAIAAGARSALAGAVPSGLRVGINTGAGVNMKQWPIEYFADLARAILAATPASVVLFGSAHESTDAARVVEAVGSPRVVDLTGQTDLPGFIATLRDVDIFVGNDTGTTHMAAATGMPVICLFSGNAPLGLFRPVGQNTVVLYRQMPCAPCGIRQLEDCAEQFACMRDITVERVLGEVMRMMETRRVAATA